MRTWPEAIIINVIIIIVIIVSAVYTVLSLLLCIKYATEVAIELTFAIQLVIYQPTP